MPAELVAHRRQQFVLIGGFAPRAEALAERRGEDRRRHRLVDGGLDRPASLAGIRTRPANSADPGPSRGCAVRSSSHDATTPSAAKPPRCRRSCQLVVLDAAASFQRRSGLPRWRLAGCPPGIGGHRPYSMPLCTILTKFARSPAVSILVPRPAIFSRPGEGYFAAPGAMKTGRDVDHGCSPPIIMQNRPAPDCRCTDVDVNVPCGKLGRGVCHPRNRNCRRSECSRLQRGRRSAHLIHAAPGPSTRPRLPQFLREVASEKAHGLFTHDSSTASRQVENGTRGRAARLPNHVGPHASEARPHAESAADSSSAAGFAQRSCW